MNNAIRAGALAVLGIISMSHAAAQQSESPQVTQSVTVANYKKASPWFLAESQHFVVYADTKREAATELLNNLERLDFLLRSYTKPYRKANSSEQKLTLYYQDRVEGLSGIDAALPADAIGLYSSCAAGVQGFGFHLGETADNEGLSYIFEAYTRHFIYRHTDIRAPAAFIDGFAQYFASVRFTDAQMIVGKTPPTIAQYLDFLDEGHRYSLDYTDVLANQIATAKNYAGDAGVRLEFAAKSWLLMHYMLASEDNRGRLSKYLNSVYQGKDAVPAFEGAFDLKASQLGTEMWRYRRTSVKVLTVDVPYLPAATVNFTALPEAASDFIMLDAAVKACPGKAAGEALLGKIAGEAGKFPKNEFGHMTLSRARIAFGDPKQALPWLTQAIAKNAGNFDAVYLSGLAHLRLAEQNNGAATPAYLQAAQQQLLNARELNPESADAAYAYFRAEVLARSELSDTALEGALTAWQSAREVGVFARSAALAHAYLGNTSQAKILLKTLALNTLDPKTATWATTWQQKLAAGPSRDDILAEMRTQQAGPAFKEWTIDTNSVMATVRYNAGLDAAQNYLFNQSVNTGSPEKVLMSVPTKR
ncbi:hypothetical protein SAMN05428959_103328 [Duganella sp. CF517]|uniref:hypothetical protein n=1 Tax=Duganella sp. CF517 TaxID=1881038 RepID=UPI0008D75CA4|nr:hypothetical protein [Duganella sp. CF517]SEN83033.1 hypothetical protein SAMN05428959_103328 [Duganella sp. CF517]